MVNIFRCIYYLNRLFCQFAFQIKVENNEFKIKTFKIDNILTSAVIIIAEIILIIVNIKCSSSFTTSLQLSLKILHFSALIILYLNSFYYQEKLKSVLKRMFEFEKKLNITSTSKAFKIYTFQKCIVFLTYIVQDILVYIDMWIMPLDCLFIAYMEHFPNDIWEITYIYITTKFQQFCKIQHNKDMNENLNNLNEIKKCKKTIELCYQIPIILKIFLRFTEALTAFDTLIKMLYFYKSFEQILHYTMSAIIWQIQVSCEIFCLLYLIQQFNNSVRINIKCCIINNKLIYLFR